jgi:hypothetical protein
VAWSTTGWLTLSSPRLLLVGELQAERASPRQAAMALAAAFFVQMGIVVTFLT